MSDKSDHTEEKSHEAERIYGHILTGRAAFNDENNYKLGVANRVKALFGALENGENFVSLLTTLPFPPLKSFIEPSRIKEQESREGRRKLSQGGRV